jgi:hypothetical protein
MRHRVGLGDMLFLPTDVIFEVGHVFFPGIGWIAALEVNPQTCPQIMSSSCGSFDAATD